MSLVSNIDIPLKTTKGRERFVFTGFKLLAILSKRFLQKASCCFFLGMFVLNLQVFEIINLKILLNLMELDVCSCEYF